MLDQATISVPIVRSGILAQEFCAAGAAVAEVAAVFERSLYLRADDRFVCIGEAGVGNGPSTLIAEPGEGRHLCALGEHQGARASISSRRIAIGSIVFTLDGCALWRPPHWPVRPSAERLVETCSELARRVALATPNYGDTLRIPPIASSSRVAKLGEYVSCHRNSRNSRSSWPGLTRPSTSCRLAEQAVEGLIGYGPGLTPSGDDVLIGALAMLDALQERDAHAVLARTINALAPGSTSPLSHSFLRAAAAGHIGERLHGIVSGVLTGDVDQAAATAHAIGHSSGWDMLAGAVIAARSLPRRPAGRGGAVRGTGRARSAPR